MNETNVQHVSRNCPVELSCVGGHACGFTIDMRQLTVLGESSIAVRGHNDDVNINVMNLAHSTSRGLQNWH
jgi:hypothetical protein